MSSRAIWEGSISIGLINIPISLHSAIRENRISLNYITPCCNTQVNQVWKCKGCGNEVERNKLKKGLNLGNNKFIILEKEELEAIRLKTIKTMDIEGFIPTNVIDPMQMAISYYIVPMDGGEKAYSLIVEALRSSQLYALARITQYGKEHIAIIRPIEHRLLLTTLYYPDEIIEPPSIPQAALDKRDSELAKQLLNSYKIENLDLSQYHNRYVEAMKELINAKMTGQPIPKAEAQTGSTIDLTSALLASVEQKKPIRKRRTNVRG